MMDHMPNQPLADLNDDFLGAFPLWRALPLHLAFVSGVVSDVSGVAHVAVSSLISKSDSGTNRKKNYHGQIYAAVSVDHMAN